MGDLSSAEMRSLIRDIADYPSPGIVFKDITPLLADGTALASCIAALAAPWRATEVDVVVGIEARGFILGSPVAHALGVGFVPIRKAGKLPGSTISEPYALEYGTDHVEIHDDAISPGDHVVVLDDVLATGGTAAAAITLVSRLGGEVAGCSFLLELAALDGRAKVGEQRIESLLLVEG